jgi:hypothetical protein
VRDKAAPRFGRQDSLWVRLEIAVISDFLVDLQAVPLTVATIMLSLFRSDSTTVGKQKRLEKSGFLPTILGE